MKNKRIQFAAIALLTANILLQSTQLFSQGLGINVSGSTPNVSALLDIDAAGMSQKGLLIPRIALTSATDAATIATPATSLLVYNTGAGALIPAGYYYNQGNPGSPNWVPFLTNNVNVPAAWSITGNTGTTGGPNFIGTTDNKSLRFRTNNTQKMILDSLGNVGIGTTVPGSKLHVSGGSFGSTTLLQIISTPRANSNTADGAILGFTASNGTLGTHDFGALFAGNNTSVTNSGAAVVELRVGGTSTTAGSSATAFIQGKSIGSSPEAYSVALRTNNTDRLFIDYGGSVGIGTAGAAYKLDVCGDVRASGSVYYGGACGTANGTIYFKPDYVFEANYSYYTPAEVEKFIYKNGHLPWLTSAKKDEKENNGAINITRMSFETLEAVENMQLQIIEQQKIINKMEAENTNFKINAELEICGLKKTVERLAKQVDTEKKK